MGEAPMIGTIQLVLEGRFALFLYQSAVEGRVAAWHVHLWL